MRREWLASLFTDNSCPVPAVLNSDDMWLALKDGNVLISALNVIEPGVVPQFHVNVAGQMHPLMERVFFVVTLKMTSFAAKYQLVFGRMLEIRFSHGQNFYAI